MPALSYRLCSSPPASAPAALSGKRPFLTIRQGAAAALRAGGPWVLLLMTLGILCCSKNASNPDGAADGGMDGGTNLSGCPGVTLAQSGALDVDVKSIQVTGNITVNSMQTPDAMLSRGAIRFVEKRTGTAVQAGLNSTGATTYQVTLGPGQYDVVLTADHELCSLGPSPLPCVGGPLRSGIMITESGALDLDIATVQVQGMLTLNGAAIPADQQPSAALSFTLLSGGDNVTVPLDPTGYQVTLLSGTYRIDYQPAGGCTGGAGLPCNSGPLKASVALSQSGALDLNIPAITVSGNITVNGAAPADPSLGSVSFQLQGGGSVSTDNVQPGAGLSPYQLSLLAGTYNVAFVPVASSCTGTIPCTGGPLKQDLALAQSGNLDVDIPSVHVTGNVTLNGAAVDPADQGQGALQFQLVGGTAVSSRAGATQMLSSYDLFLMPGTYNINYAASAGCQDSIAAPCNSGPLKSGIVISTAGALDIDVPSAKVQGNVTVGQAVVPAGSQNAGYVVFALTGAGGGNYLIPGGLMPYSARLLRGTYNINFAHGGNTCDVSLGVPCTAGTIKSNVSVMQDGALDVDVPVVQVSGKVTLNGGQLPDVQDDRGELTFALSQTFQPVFDLGRMGAAAYQVLLLPGAYKVGYQPVSFACGNGQGESGLPCDSQILTGCTP